MAHSLYSILQLVSIRKFLSTIQNCLLKKFTSFNCKLFTCAWGIDSCSSLWLTHWWAWCPGSGRQMPFYAKSACMPTWCKIFRSVNERVFLFVLCILSWAGLGLQVYAAHPWYGCTSPSGSSCHDGLDVKIPGCWLLHLELLTVSESRRAPIPTHAWINIGEVDVQGFLCCCHWWKDTESSVRMNSHGFLLLIGHKLSVLFTCRVDLVALERH